MSVKTVARRIYMAGKLASFILPLTALCKSPPATKLNTLEAQTNFALSHLLYALRTTLISGPAGYFFSFTPAATLRRRALRRMKPVASSWL